NGMAGERFAVRNSGATAVVEGIGDHGCEYMTGGRALILGETGRNFAAGMSGGIAWIYDIAGNFRVNCNQEMVELDPLDTEDENSIIALLKRHIHLTKSERANFILQNWANEKCKFIKVFPREYKNVLLKKLVKAELAEETVMGKPTGFLECERALPQKEAVASRTQNYQEFVHSYSDEQLNQQAARCMSCGIP